MITRPVSPVRAARSADRARSTTGARWWTSALLLVVACGGADEAADEAPVDVAPGAEANQLVVGAPHVLPGKIQAEDYATGGEGVGYHDTTKGNKGGQYRQDDVDIQPKESGDGYHVGWIEKGEWLAYKVDVKKAGAYAFKARVASGQSGAKRLRLTVDGKASVSGSFTSADGWQSWTDLDFAALSLTAGSHTLRLEAETGGFNLNSLEGTLGAGGANPDPTPPKPSTMWVGAAAKRGGDSGLDVWLDASSEFGPWRVRRSFEQGIPTNISQTPAGQDAASKVISFLSIKPSKSEFPRVAKGDFDDELTSLARSFPTDHTTYLTMQHEPENDDMGGKAFVAMFRQFYRVVKKANPHILVGTVHMSFQWRPGSPTTAAPDEWWAGPDGTDFLGIDDYNDARTDGRTSAGNDPAFQRWYGWASTKGKPLAVVEFGRLDSPKDAQARARDLLDSERWLRDHQFFMFLYWDSIGDKDIDWRLTGGATRDAMRAISSRGKTGW